MIALCNTIGSCGSHHKHHEEKSPLLLHNTDNKAIPQNDTTTRKQF